MFACWNDSLWCMLYISMYIIHFYTEVLYIIIALHDQRTVHVVIRPAGITCTIIIYTDTKTL